MSKDTAKEMTPESGGGITAISLIWGDSPRWLGGMQLIDDDWLTGFMDGYHCDDLDATRKLLEAEKRKREKAVEECGDLEDEIDEWQSSTMLDDDGGDPSNMTPIDNERNVLSLMRERDAAISELEAAKEELARREENQYDRQTAPLTPEEMNPIHKALAEYDATAPESTERDTAFGQIERALEGLCQGRALALFTAKRALGIGAEEAVQAFMPVATKLRAACAMTMGFDLNQVLVPILKEHEAAIERMQFMKLLADAAPEKTAPTMGLVEVAEKTIRTITKWSEEEKMGLLSIEECLEIRDDLEAALPEKERPDAPR